MSVTTWNGATFLQIGNRTHEPNLLELPKVQL